jgi:hypothetical protein
MPRVLLRDTRFDFNSNPARDSAVDSGRPGTWTEAVGDGRSFSSEERASRQLEQSLSDFVKFAHRSVVWLTPYGVDRFNHRRSQKLPCGSRRSTPYT